MFSSLRGQAVGVGVKEGIGGRLAGGEGDGGCEVAVGLAERVGDGVDDLGGGEVLRAGDDEAIEWARDERRCA
jgi:hypothetical protein